MELRRVKSRSSLCATILKEDSSVVGLRTESASMASASLTTAPATSSTPTSVLYSVLLRALVSRRAAAKDSAERSLHLPTPSSLHSSCVLHEMDDSLTKTLRAQVTQLFPFCGLIIEPAGAVDLDKMTPAQWISSSASNGGERGRNGCRVACIASVNAYGHLSQFASSETRQLEPSITLSSSTQVSSLPTTEGTPKREPGRRSGQPKVIFKSFPSSKTALAAVQAAAAYPPPQISAVERSNQLFVSPPADRCSIIDSRVVGTSRDPKAGSSQAPRAPVESSKGITVSSAAALPVMQRHLEELFDDFAAAVEQCHSALSRQQLQGSSAATWPRSGEAKAAPSEGIPASSPGAEYLTSRNARYLQQGTISSHRHGNPTILLADVMPDGSDHRVMSGLSNDCISDDWVRNHGTTIGVKASASFSSTPIADIESQREAPGPAGHAAQHPEEEDLPRGIVLIAHTIAEHLYAVLHPTSTAAALEGVMTELPRCKGGDSSGAGELSGLDTAATTSLYRRSHTGVTNVQKRSASSASVHSLHPSQTEQASRPLHSHPVRTWVSSELRELQHLAHTLLWSRITTYLRLCLKMTECGASMSPSTDVSEPCEASASVQLPFWIWLYAASGLANDVIHQQQEAQRASVNPVESTGPHKALIPSSSTMGVQPPLSLPQLLPTVETLARQLQRREYMRVQSTAETLLTANTFLALSGVQMTHSTVMERLLPLQSGAAASDALGVAALFPSSEQRVTDKAPVGMESSSGSGNVGVFGAVAVPSFISTNATSDRRISLKDHTVLTFGGTSSIPVDRSGSRGGITRRSPPYRGRGASYVSESCGGHKISPWIGEELQSEHRRGFSAPSTAELYLQWLETADSANTTARGLHENTVRYLDRVEVEATVAGGAVGFPHMLSQQSRPDAITRNNPCVSLFAEDSDVSECDEETARKDSDNRTDEGSSEMFCNDLTEQSAHKVFRLGSVMPSADFAPGLGRVEKELHQASFAVQFARKLGTLYATQDMNTLLPLLPAVAQEGLLFADANLASACTESGVVESLGAALPPRGCTDGLGTSSTPAAPAVSVRPQNTWRENPTTGSVVEGGLPPTVATTSHVAAERLSANHTFSCRHATINGTSPTLFSTVPSLSKEQRLLMDSLSSCRDAIAANSSQLFLDNARALEVAFSLALVLLSHVMSEAVPKGSDVRAEGMTSVGKSVEKSPEPVSGKAVTVTVNRVQVKRHPSKFSSHVPASFDHSGAKAPTTTGEAVPPLGPLPMDLAKVFGLGSSRSRWQRLSAYIRENLISLSLSALQRKDAAKVQVLLQYITLDTGVSHHYSRGRRSHASTALATTTGAGGAKTAVGSTIKKRSDSLKASEHQAIHRSASLHDKSLSFVDVWFSSFASLVDTTAHLFQGDHNTPSSLKGAVWHLAGLAQFFLLTRARGYALYGGRCHLHSITLSGCCGCGDEVDGRNSSMASQAALRVFITSHLVEPAEKVLGVVVAFMESVCKALSAEMESGAASEQQLREGVLFADDSSGDESLSTSPMADGSARHESVCESASVYSTEGGGTCGIAAKHSEISDSQTCWMELSIHYFLEIVDVLLDVALYLPEKPLYLYQLTVSASHAGVPSTDFMDDMVAMGSTGIGGSLHFCGLGDLPLSAGTGSQRAVTDSQLGRVQEFLSMYTSMVLQSAVNHFTLDGRQAQLRFARARGASSNAGAASGGASENHSSHLFWERLLLCTSAPLESATQHDSSFTTRQSPPSASAAAGVPAARAAIGAEGSIRSLGMCSTMWWPGARFQRYSHLTRILEHAQLVSLYLNSSVRKDPAARASNLLYPEFHRSSRDCAPSLQVSAVTSLLNTSTGPCAQLLSIPYACPPSSVDTSVGGRASGVARAAVHERCCFHCTVSPVDQSPSCFPASEHRRLMREVCGGLWIRVELLRLLRLAAAPLDTDTFAHFTSTASEVATRVQDKALQAHYKTIASMKAATESVMPKKYASTYVRLLFLRYVQAFYADIQALGASRSSTVFDHATSEHMDSTDNVTSPGNSAGPLPSSPIHAEFNARGDGMYRPSGSLRVRPPTTPFHRLSQHLWTQYCRVLLSALRKLCWNSSEAHNTAANLSVASVFGRLLEMISGRQELDEDEAIDDGEISVDGAQSETNPSWRDVGMSGVSLDRSLDPCFGAEDHERKTFGDFTDFSSNSSATVAPGMSEGGEGLPGKSQQSSPLGHSRQQRKSMPVYLRSRAARVSTRANLQVATKVSDLGQVSGVRGERQRRERHSSISGRDAPEVRGQRSLSISGVSASTPTRSTAPAPPVKPRLSLTGLMPPLYFASSGDTAAAQEDKFYREQSKQREITDGFRDTRSAFAGDTSYVSQDDDEVEENEISFDTSAALSKSTLQKSTSQETREGYTIASPNASFSTSVGTPTPPAVQLPMLCLGALGPPLYFTSAGDTGVFAETTVATPLPQSPATAFQALKWPKPAPSATAGAVHVDPAATGAPLRAAPPPPTTATVAGFLLPKLSFDSLGPPLYFTSTGDTGGFVEEQIQRPPVAVGGAAAAQPRVDVDCARLAFLTVDVASNGVVNPTTATASGVNVLHPPTNETTIAQARGSLSSFVSNSSSVFSSCSDLAPVRGGGDGGDYEREEGGGCAGHTGGQGAKGQVRARQYGGSVSSLNSQPIREVGMPSQGTSQPQCKRVHRASRLVLTPTVAPVVTMELILSICSIILQQGSGMIQYVYTVSSLTQKRMLPGICSSSQRRWHTGGSRVAAASGTSCMQNTDAVQGDRWRYTPQHSPSSFHVIQAMHNYLKDNRNKVVIDLLEEWVLDKYAATERARMALFETIYGPSRQPKDLPQPPHVFSSYNINSNSHINSECFQHPQHPHEGIVGGGGNGKPNAAMLVGRYVLLRLLLPRLITPLVTQKNERRIGSGGYGSVTSGFVQELGADGETQLPAEWGQQGFRWRPAETGGGATSGGFGIGGGGNTPHSAHTVPSLATAAERVTPSALDGMRAPWRKAAQRIAQVACKCEVAVKHIPLSARGSESGNLPLCHAEVLAMYRLCGHPHIVPLLSFDNTKDEYILVLPHYAQGSLRLWRQKYYPLGCAVLKMPPGVRGMCKSASMSAMAGPAALSKPTSASVPNTSLFATCARCLLQVLKAVTFMHDQHIRHGDIKCDNVLIAAADAGGERDKVNLPMLPSSVCLCDFGSCDTCDDDDMKNLKHDIMAGETRFLAGRWGVGRGTEAIQPPEHMSAKRRYVLLRRIMEAGAPVAAAAAQSPPSVALSERVDAGAHAASILGSSVEYPPPRSRAGELMELTGRQVTEWLRRAELSADIWACGCLLYEMLTGRMLFGEARLGRLLVLAAAGAGESQTNATVTSKTNAAASTFETPHRPTQRATASTRTNVAGDEGFGATSPISRRALDDWERQDLEGAVGERVVNFMSALLDLDPLQRPSAHEALYSWEDIMVEAGLDV